MTAIKKPRKNRKVTASGLLAWLTHQQHKTGFVPTSREAARHFNCCQTLIMQYLHQLIRWGHLLKKGRQYAIRQKYTSDLPRVAGWYWYIDYDSKYTAIYQIATDPDDGQLALKFDDGYVYMENFKGDWCGPIPQPIS